MGTGKSEARKAMARRTAMARQYLARDGLAAGTAEALDAIDELGNIDGDDEHGMLFDEDLEITGEDASNLDGRLHVIEICLHVLHVNVVTYVFFYI